MKTDKKRRSLFESDFPESIVDIRTVNGGLTAGVEIETVVTGDTESTLGGTDCGDFVRGSSFPYDQNPTRVFDDQ